MPLDFSVLDDELAKKGIDPQAAVRLLNFTPRDAKADLVARAGGMSSGSQRGLPAPIERLKENPQGLFFGSLAAKPTSLLNFAGQPAEPKGPRPHEWVPPREDLEQQVKSALAKENLGDPSRLMGWARSGMAASGNSASSTQPTSAMETPTQTATPPRSIEEEYRGLLKDEPTRAQFPAEKMAFWKKLLGAATSVAAGMGGERNAAGKTARRFFGGPERRAEEKFEQAHGEWEGKARNLLRLAKLRQEDLQDRNLQSEIDARSRPKTEKPENLDREAYDYYVGQGMTPAEARKRVLEDAQSVKPERQTHTSPFEAFAYGDPQERKAAQDFLDMEKRIGSRYRNPSEFEEKYRLFKEHPDDYKAIFGEPRGSGPDRATATRMLNYFGKRRREVNGDFTLDDEQKKQQLQEIENLERPFMDAVQPGAQSNSSDRVTVVHPNGGRGTVPRSQLEAAKKKGYREVPPN